LGDNFIIDDKVLNEMQFNPTKCPFFIAESETVIFGVESDAIFHMPMKMKERQASAATFDRYGE
jgi:hypothetical protein